MLVTEIFESHNPLDAEYLVEQIEAEMMLELFGGLGGIASAGMNKMKQAGQAVKGAYNDGEVKSLLGQLGKYKEQLKTLFQRNPHAFTPQQSPEVMQARPAANPAKERYQQERQAGRADTRRPSTNSLSALSSAEQRAGLVKPARRRAPSMQNAGMVPNATAPAVQREMPSMQTKQRKPHVRLRANRPHMENQEMYDEIITELFGGLGGMARAAGGAIKQAGKSIGGAYAKGEAKAIMQKMAGIISALKERGYQLPPELAREIQQLQQSAA